MSIRNGKAREGSFDVSQSCLDLYWKISVYDIIKDVNPNNIGLIKVDIEGGDEDVFEELMIVGSKYGWKIWISFHYGWWKDKNVDRFTHLVPLIKKVSKNDIEISKYDLLPLININVPETFLIEL